MSMGDCDCYMPNCFECFERMFKKAEQLGCYDLKDLVQDWIIMQNNEMADNDFYEMIEQDYSPEALKELLKNPNEW